MTCSSRYNTSHLPEVQFESGSHGRVLRNRLHVTRKREMDVIEAELYALVQPKLMGMFTKDHCFTTDDVCTIHKAWLEEVYEWAGQYRQVNVSKGDFSFAMARHVPQLMQDFKNRLLSQYTPCTFATDEEIINAMAEVHTELMLIHPFREGNGRAGRLLAVLMAFQAGLPGLDFTGIQGKRKKEYFAAVQAGLDRNYEPMKKVFRSVLSRTRRTHAQRL
ncbi:MAG: Fic family protein [Nitrospirae bacterium]|nr:Fic family protein [Nitrospirota bacterium]